MDEVWKDIEGFEGQYEISNFGRVKSVSRVVYFIGRNQFGSEFLAHKVCPERILKTYIRGRYEHIGLRKESNNFNFPVHRLVAIHFIENPNGLPIINHKDENPLNNRVDNLEWCDTKYNANYGTRNERIAEKLKERPEYYIPVLCYDLENNFVKRYESAEQASKELNISSGGITSCCRLYKGRASAGGYKWKYADSDLDISSIEYKPLKKFVHQFDLEGKYINTFDSLSEVARNLGKDIRNVSKAVKKGLAYGYVWLVDDNEEKVETLLREIYEKSHHIYQINEKGLIVSRFKSALEAEEKTGNNHSNISTAMHKKHNGKLYRKTGGYYWVDVRKDPNYEIDFEYKRNRGERKIIQYDLSGNKLREFDSVADAQEYLGLPRDKSSSIYDCLKANRKNKTAYGYIWKKAEEVE